VYSSWSAFLSTRLIDRHAGHRRRVLELYTQRVRADYFTRPLREQRRDEALAALLQHARQQVPFFQARLAAAHEITPGRALEILRQLPVMRRSDIQADPASFLAAGAGETMDDFTGGSSGTPLSFKIDRATQQAREASLRWANNLAGGSTGDRIAMLWGSDRDSTAASRDWRLDLRWWLDNMRWYNAFNMGEDRMAEYHACMTRFRPHLVVAYAGSIFTYARFLEAHDLTPRYPITSIVSSAEVLTAPMRETVERVFRVPVFDRYGNREAGAIAAECEAHKGLHINETDFVVEVDSRDPYNEPGPLLITYLANRAMPLIRYDTGDLATLHRGECTCGRTTMRLAAVVGRQSDTIRTASGSLIHGEYFTHVLYGSKGVREFQFVQETLRNYRLLVVVDQRNAEDEACWLHKIREVLGPGSEVTVEYVKDIPALTSGKRKFTLSLLTGNRPPPGV
jgi:phenylacetate-CoA ligase